MSEEALVAEGAEQPDQQAAEQARVADENRARMSGWTPKEEFKGDPNRWKDASTWNKMADDYMPFARATIKTLEGTLGATQVELASLKKTMAQVIQANEAVSQREYTRALETIRKEQVAAITEGDAEKWQKLEQDKDALQNQKPAKIVIPQDNPQDIAARNRASFQTRNSEWYGKDPELTGFAVYVGNQLAQRGVPEVDQFAEVERAVKEKFPQKFGNQRRDESAVDGGSGMPARPVSGKKQTYDALPAEAKTACNTFVQSVTTRYPTRDAKQERAEWVKNYFGEE